MTEPAPEAQVKYLTTLAEKVDKERFDAEFAKVIKGSDSVVLVQVRRVRVAQWAQGGGGRDAGGEAVAAEQAQMFPEAEDSADEPGEWWGPESPGRWSLSRCLVSRCRA